MQRGLLLRRLKSKAETDACARSLGVSNQEAGCAKYIPRKVSLSLRLGSDPMCQSQMRFRVPLPSLGFANASRS